MIRLMIRALVAPLFVCTGLASAQIINPAFIQQGGGTVPRSFLSKGQDIVSVKDFGAKGDNSTDDTAAVQAAVNKMAAGGGVYLPANGCSVTPCNYKTTAAIVFPVTSIRIRFFSDGATLRAAHNGDALTLISTNENYGGHTIENITITGPNTFFPAPGYVPISTGACINMNRDATTNAVASYNSETHNVVCQGFKYGLNMQAVIGHKDFGGYYRFNQYGIYIDGGQTNANKFFGTHIRENRKAGVYSTGRSGGSLSNATANLFYGCAIETNLPYVSGYASGEGAMPADSVGVYLNNSYDFVFVGGYSENHAASFYLAGASKGHRIIGQRIGRGTGRQDKIVLSGTGIYNNYFDVTANPGSLTAVNVVSDHANQLFNEFRGAGLNFVAGSNAAPLDYDNVKPDLSFANIKGTGLVRMPSQGYVSNISEGTAPGLIEGIGTTTATLHMQGVGEIQIGNGLTSDTTVTVVEGVVPNSFLTIHNYQIAHSLTIKPDSTDGTGAIYTKMNRSVVLDKYGQEITFWVNGQRKLREVGRNFSDRLFGTASLADTHTYVDVTFAIAEPDANYVPLVFVATFGGTPNGDAWKFSVSNITASGFRINLVAAPGAGNTMYFNWEAIRKNV